MNVNQGKKLMLWSVSRNLTQLSQLECIAAISQRRQLQQSRLTPSFSRWRSPYLFRYLYHAAQAVPRGAAARAALPVLLLLKLSPDPGLLSAELCRTAHVRISLSAPTCGAAFCAASSPCLCKSLFKVQRVGLVVLRGGSSAVTRSPLACLPSVLQGDCSRVASPSSENSAQALVRLSYARSCPSLLLPAPPGTPLTSRSQPWKGCLAFGKDNQERQRHQHPCVPSGWDFLMYFKASLN